MTIEIIVYFTFVARLVLATANYMELQQYLRTHTQPPEVTEASLPQRQQNVRLGSMDGTARTAPIDGCTAPAACCPLTGAYARWG